MDAHIKEIQLKRAFEHAGLLQERSGQGSGERLVRGEVRPLRVERVEPKELMDRGEGQGNDQRRQPMEKPAESLADREALEHYLGDVKERLARNNVELKFTFHDDTGSLQVELVNGEDKVVRKIPPDELLRLSASLKEMAGAFLNRSV